MSNAKKAQSRRERKWRMSQSDRQAYHAYTRIHIHTHKQNEKGEEIRALGLVYSDERLLSRRESIGPGVQPTKISLQHRISAVYVCVCMWICLREFAGATRGSTSNNKRSLYLKRPACNHSRHFVRATRAFTRVRLFPFPRTYIHACMHILLIPFEKFALLRVTARIYRCLAVRVFKLCGWEVWST